MNENRPFVFVEASSKADLLAKVRALNTEEQMRNERLEATTATIFVKALRSEIIAGIAREFRPEKPASGGATLSGLTDLEVSEAVLRLQATRKAEGKELSFQAATKEILAGREDEFMAGQMREMNRPHVERMRAFNRARQEPVPSLDEREAAVANDPTIHAEAELMASREGINFLDAIRKIERTRTLEARVAAAGKK